MPYVFCNPSYTGSQGTFNSYRREVERLLQYTWLIVDKGLSELSRDDIGAFIRFCQKPPKAWIGLKKATKFIEKAGKRREWVFTLRRNMQKPAEIENSI